MRKPELERIEYMIGEESGDRVMDEHRKKTE
jgi:hypothetical protein